MVSPGIAERGRAPGAAPAREDASAAPGAVEARAYRVCLALAVVLLFATRAPHLAGPGAMLDGDEAIAGLMAKHLAEGRSLPVFFYGQHFSLSIVEAAIGALAFRLFGVSSAVLQCAELAFWAVGAVALAAAVRDFARPRAGAAAALLLAVAPAWYVWAHKARPGYSTAFVVSAIAIRLVARGWRSGRWPAAALAAIGVCLALAAAGYSPAVLALAPFLLLVPVRQWPRAIAWVGGGALAVAALLALAVAGDDPYWAPSVMHAPDSLAPLRDLRWRLSVALGGGYHMAERLDGGAWVRAAGVAWSTALLALAPLALWRGVRRRALTPDVAAALGAAALCGFSLLVESFSFRYLLPIGIPAVLLVALACDELASRSLAGRRAAAAAVALLLALSLGGDAGLARLAFSGMQRPVAPEAAGDEHDDVLRLLAELDRRGVRRVYSLDHLFQWNLTFESDERVIARWIQPVDRVPDYPRAVDAAHAAGEPTALVGYAQHAAWAASAATPEDGRPEIVAGRFFLVSRPSAEMLRRLGYATAPR